VLPFANCIATMLPAGVALPTGLFAPHWTRTSVYLYCTEPSTFSSQDDVEVRTAGSHHDLATCLHGGRGRWSSA
jgi:hypothetical protein